MIPDPFAQSLGTRSARHSLVRAGSPRRQLSIPNPISFSQLAKCIEINWDSIAKHCEESKISLSKPHLPASGRAIIPRYSLGDLPEHRASLRATSRFILQTDIANCYASIYTYSLPWALYGRETAKKERHDDDLPGNQLDKIVRSSQDGQTISIPVSPDTSFVLAEILLSAVDRRFCEKMEEANIEVNGYRSVQPKQDKYY